MPLVFLEIFVIDLLLPAYYVLTGIRCILGRVGTECTFCISVVLKSFGMRLCTLKPGV